MALGQSCQYTALPDTLQRTGNRQSMRVLNGDTHAGARLCNRCEAFILYLGI